jgi:hypothetical protein
MNEYAKNFLQTLTWYRSISNRLIDEIPAKYMHEAISYRSLPPACQLVDLGDFHMRVVKLINPRAKDIVRPNPDNATKQEMKSYISKTQKTLEKTLFAIPNKENFTITWFDRMTFTFPDILSFILAHEAMHHGELMSFIYDKDLPMPHAFTDTWGMC